MEDYYYLCSGRTAKATVDSTVSETEALVGK